MQEVKIHSINNSKDNVLLLFNLSILSEFLEEWFINRSERFQYEMLLSAPHLIATVKLLRIIASQRKYSAFQNMLYHKKANKGR